MCETYIKFDDLCLKPQLIDFWKKIMNGIQQKKKQFHEYQHKGTEIGMHCSTAVLQV